MRMIDAFGTSPSKEGDQADRGYTCRGVGRPAPRAVQSRSTFSLAGSFEADIIGRREATSLTLLPLCSSLNLTWLLCPFERSTCRQPEIADHDFPQISTTQYMIGVLERATGGSR